jgi:hypothetical protein
LVFAAIEGPVGSFYEDVLLFFDIRVPPQEKMETKIFFHPFFEKIVIQSEGVAIQDKFSGLIRFSWNNETLPEIFQAEMPYDSKENSIPILLRFFSIISGKNVFIASTFYPRSIGMYSHYFSHILYRRRPEARATEYGTLIGGLFLHRNFIESLY